jgi:hypothetical protein
MTGHRYLFGCLAAAFVVAGAIDARAQDFDGLVPGASSTGAHRQGAPPQPRPAAPSPAQAPASRPARKPPEAPIQVARPAPGHTAPVTIATSLDRTAVWLGEPFTFTVDVSCPPGTDILAADVSRDRLRPTGLEITQAAQTRSVDNDGTIRYRTRFTLVSYVTDGTAVGLEPQPVRYYAHTAGQSPETLVPAAELAIAPVTVAVRSTLPDANVSWLRDSAPAATLPAALTYLAPVGTALVVLSFIPLVAGGVSVVRYRAPQRSVRAPRNTSRQREWLDELRRIDATGDAADRHLAFSKLNDLIRDRLTDLELPARGLTADELAPLLDERAPRLAGLDLGSILRDCERALYGGPAQMPPAGGLRPAIDSAEQLLTAKLR